MGRIRTANTNTLVMQATAFFVRQLMWDLCIQLFILLTCQKMFNSFAMVNI